MQNSIRAAAIVIGLVALATLPSVAQTREGGRVTEAALTVSGARISGGHHRAAVAASDDTHGKTRKQARKSGKSARKIRISKGAVPRSTFENRTARYFDPLSLSIATETRIDPATTQYNQVVGTFVPVDKGQIAAAPDDPTAHEISSASIENLERGNNHTIVVPLFKLLNKLSDQPPPQQ